MKRGKRPGSPKTGGRKKGSKNKRTRELLEKAEAGGQSAIDYMLEVMRDKKNDTSLRLDAAKAVAPYLHARRAPEDRGREYGSSNELCAPRSRGAGMMAYPEITCKDFATLARNRGHTAESLAERFRGMIEEPREFFERVMTCKYKHEDRSYVVIPYRSVIEFYLEELHYFGDSHAMHRRCACGCGAPVFDRKKWASPACKKRIQRNGERKAA